MKLFLILTEEELAGLGGDAAKLEQSAYDFPADLELPRDAPYGSKLLLNFLEVVVVDA